MNLLFKKWCIASLLLFGFISNTHAQLTSQDSLLLQKSKSHLLQVYEEGIGDQAGKFNGGQFIRYPKGIIALNPYYLSPDFRKSSIVYEGITFNNLNLLHDEVADLVLLEDSTHQIQLINEKLSAFSIGKDKFVYLQNQSPQDELPQHGYYQVLVDKKVGLYKKEFKKISERLSSGELVYLIDPSIEYFVKLNGHYQAIYGKKSLLTLFKNKEQEIRRYIKTEHLKFNKDKDIMFSKVVDYYNLLNK
jgi:hypothetical protein